MNIANSHSPLHLVEINHWFWFNYNRISSIRSCSLLNPAFRSRERDGGIFWMKWIRFPFRFEIIFILCIFFCYFLSIIRRRSIHTTHSPSYLNSTIEQVKHIIHNVWNIRCNFDEWQFFLLCSVFCAQLLLFLPSIEDCGCLNFLLHLSSRCRRGIAVYDIWHESITTNEQTLTRHEPKILFSILKTRSWVTRAWIVIVSKFSGKKMSLMLQKHESF